MASTEKITNTDKAPPTDKAPKGDKIPNGERASNSDRIPNGAKGTNGDKVTNDDKVTNGDKFTNGNEVSNGDKVTNGDDSIVVAFGAFITSVKTLSSQDDFKLVFSYFDEIKRLQGELTDKEQAFAAHTSITTDLAKQKLSLQKILDERDEMIAQLRKKRNDLRDQVQKLEEQSSKQKGVIEKAKVKVKEQGEGLNAKGEQIQELEEKLKQAYDRSSQLEADLDALRATNDSLVRKHDTAASRLEEVDSFAVALREEDSDTVATKMGALWEAAKEFIVSYFKEDLPEHSLQNDSIWEKLIDPEYFSHHVPLPPTNSTHAKKMRIAVVLAIVARSLDFHIFCPTYVLGEDSGVREVLCHLAVSDSKKESFCRGLLLSFFLDKQENAANERIESATEYIMRHVRGLLSRPKVEEFEAGVRQLARSAHETWATIRAIKQRYEPSFETTQIEGFNWDTFLFDSDVDGSIDQQTAIQGGRDDEILIILPRLYVIEKNQQPRLIVDGTVLRRSQSLAAAQELEGLQLVPQSSPTFGRNASSRMKSRRTRMSGTWNGDRSSESQRSLE